MPEEQEASMPQVTSLSGEEGLSPGKMSVRDVLRQSGQLSGMFGQGQGQGQGQGADVNQGAGDMAKSLGGGLEEGVGQAASKMADTMGGAIKDIAGGDGGGDTDVSQGMEEMMQQAGEMLMGVADQAIDATKKAVTMAAGAAVGMGGGGTMAMGSGGGGAMEMGGIKGLGGKSGGEADAGIADIARMIGGKGDKENKLSVRQATGLSLPLPGMGVEGPKQGMKMR